MNQHESIPFDLEQLSVIGSLEAQRLVDALKSGASVEEMLPRLYDELRNLAGRLLQGERVHHTLTPTALVHEAYLRLHGARPDEKDYRSSSHFFPFPQRQCGAC